MNLICVENLWAAVENMLLKHISDFKKKILNTKTVQVHVAFYKHAFIHVYDYILFG